MNIEIWQIDLTQGLDLTRATALLDADEIRRAQRLINPAHGQRFIAAHAGLREILARWTGADPSSLVFAQTDHGRPFLRDGGPVFSLSHSGDLALVAVASGGELGIDLERRHTMRHVDVARRFFSRAEAEAIAALSGDAGESAFFDCWVRKEAYIKAKGLGLALPLESFELPVPFYPGDGLRCSARFPDDPACFRFRLLDVPAGYHAALAWTVDCAVPAAPSVWPLDDVDVIRS